MVITHPVKATGLSALMEGREAGKAKGDGIA